MLSATIVGARRSSGRMPRTTAAGERAGALAMHLGLDIGAAATHPGHAGDALVDRVVVASAGRRAAAGRRRGR